MKKIATPLNRINNKKNYPNITETSIRTYESYDLTLFKNHPLNRSITNVKISRIVESFKQQYLYVPAIVVQTKNGFLVVDGGNRLAALQEYNKMFLGSDTLPQLPFIFIVYKEDTITINDIRRINGCTSNWTLEDYCISFLKEGKEGFILLNTLRKKYNKIPLTLTICIATGHNALSRTLFGKLKCGVLDSIPEKACFIIGDKIMDFYNITPNFTINKTAWFAILRLITMEGYNHTKFMKKLKTNKNLVKKLNYHSNLQQYGADFDIMYNYRENKNDILDINREFTSNWTKHRESLINRTC